MEINNIGTGFKRGTKYRPIITVGNNKQSTSKMVRRIYI